MPGSFTFRPIEAKLTHDTELFGKMSPYCEFQIGDFITKSNVCSKGGKHPQWSDVITVPAPLKHNDLLNIHVMDKNTFSKEDEIGTFSLNLHDLESTGKISKWYPIYFKNEQAGEILMESMFDGDLSEISLKKTELIEERDLSEVKTTNFIEDKAVTQSGVTGYEPEVKVFHEQRQTVEPHTFVKEVDVVETRATTQNIEVMEPVKVMKDVEYTEVIPVKKQVETIEPQVVKKQIEVIEPQLVTKTIQVVENVPVMREVEVIESIAVTKEIETMEPRTFTKQVEVTDYVPVTKQVEVTEPVHLKKTVEYVEPVITTQTITKKIREPVIVNEEITTSVGPATLIEDEKILKEKLTGKTIVEDVTIEKEQF